LFAVGANRGIGTASVARETWEVECPRCGARLKVDAARGKVLAHHPPARARRVADLEHSRQLLEEEAARREAQFRQSAEDEKNKARLLERKFEEALKRAQGESEGCGSR